MKFCTKCKIEKDLTDFSIDHKAKDGFSYQCRVCNKKYRQLHKKEIAAYRQIPTSKESHNRRNQKYRSGHSKQIIAQSTVNNAIRAGKMQRSIFCEECSLPAETEGHHADYSKPLEVDWLCKQCHIEIHKERKIA